MKQMHETSIDRAAMGRLAKALTFTCGADRPTTVDLNPAATFGRFFKGALKAVEVTALRTLSGDNAQISRSPPAKLSSAVEPRLKRTRAFALLRVCVWKTAIRRHSSARVPQHP
jgi:hypothetical protein